MRGVIMALAGLALSPLATLQAQDAASRPATVLSDPVAIWDRFLKHGSYAEAYSAYEVLGEVGYDLNSVDPERCREQRAQLDKAIALAPVSIALQRAGMLCAEAVGDDAGAERALDVLGALSRLALADGKEIISPKPIRVLGPSDIYALLATSGLQYRYEYYMHVNAQRYFPLVVAAWDAELSAERHLTFDYIDVVHALDHADPFSGYPVQRQLLAEAFVEAQAKANETQALDWQAVKAASQIVDPKQKVQAVRGAAELGGLQAAGTWLLVCAMTPYQGCADGLVDSLLPFAEKKQAAHMMLLALAYAKGVGVERDGGAASTLLDAADKLWSRSGAVISFAQLWTTSGEQSYPAFLEERIATARRDSSASMSMLSAQRTLGKSDKPVLSPQELEGLAHPENNATGRGYALLASYYQRVQDGAHAQKWLDKAVAAGDPGAQATDGISRHAAAKAEAERAIALARVAQGAQGGNELAARYMGFQSRRVGKYADAEAWLLGPARVGDVEAILELAQIYEWERPGIRGSRQQAIDTYRALDQDNDNAEARRRLAAMALSGRGLPEDPAQAERLLLKDASRGNQASTVILAIAYLDGEFGKPDLASGHKWMEQAMRTGDADVTSDYGAWFFYRSKPATLESRRRGLALWEQGAKAGGQTALNNLAWAHCTAPEPEIFDPAKGKTEADQLIQDGDLPLGFLDTVAACRAAAGAFDQAVELQNKVIAGLAPEELAEDRKRKENFEARLALYRSGKRYIELPRTEP
jgi:TPR repeat protein